VPVPVPFTSPEPLLDALEKAIGPRTRLAAFDHVTSAGATLLPLERMIGICRSKGVPVAVDGAHALGMFPLDIPALGADWYVGNLHKWCFAAKGTAVIWCSPERQAELHPVSISHYLGQGFVAEFDYSGTRDNSGWLAAPVALDYLENLGVAALSRRNKALATEAAEMLAKEWRSDIAAAEPWRGSIASVRLPGGAGGDRTAARGIAKRLIEEHRISAGVMVTEGCLWLRVSAQVYNELSDYRRIAAVGRDIASR
jgi:isopenicillin-N epimerase